MNRGDVETGDSPTLTPPPVVRSRRRVFREKHTNKDVNNGHGDHDGDDDDDEERGRDKIIENNTEETINPPLKRRSRNVDRGRQEQQQEEEDLPKQDDQPQQKQDDDDDPMHDNVEKEDTKDTITVKQKKKGKKQQKIPQQQEEQEQQPPQQGQQQEEGPKLLFCVRVNKSDTLKPDVNLSHPLKSEATRPVATNFEFITTGNVGTGERKPQPCDFVLPIMTQPFSLRRMMSSLPEQGPSWEEDLLWNEAYDHILTEKTLLLFEILEFGAKLPAARLVDGWMGIAWGFLVPQPTTAATGLQDNIPLRLQLFSYPLPAYRKIIPSNPKTPRIFKLWSSHKRTRYPATLHVTIRATSPPSSPPAPVLRPFTPLDTQFLSRPWVQSETALGSASTTVAPESSDNPDTEDEKQEANASGVRRALHVHRERGQNCLIPDSILYRLDSGSRGCFGVQFSHSGQFLAALCADMAMFPIMVYDVFSGKCIHTFSGHHDMVYDIAWGEQDDTVLTSSSDGTAKIWPLPKVPSSSVVPVTFQHTCFVYCGQFHPTAANPSLVVTGAYDNIIRVWDRGSAKVIHEISGHRSNVNALAFEKTGERLFSGDGGGMVHVWDSRGGGLSLLKIISSFQGSPINAIRIHPHGRRLLVHTRNSSIHSLDSRFYTISSSFTSMVNVEWPIKSSYSACGKYVATGSENGKIIIFEEESRTVVHTYVGASFGLVEPVTSIEWHPSHHILALCAFGPRAPILVFGRNLDVEPPSLASTVDDKMLLAHKSRLDLASKILATPSTPVSNTSTLPPLSSTAPSFVNRTTLPPLPPLTPSIHLSDSNFHTPSKAMLLSSSRSPWMLNDTSLLSSSSPLRRSRLDLQPQPSADDLRRNQKKFRRKRREATLTQLRKERPTSPLPRSPEAVDEGELIEPIPTNVQNNVKQHEDSLHPLGILEND